MQSGGDCFIPTPGMSVALDAHRAVRYDALLELIDQLQRRRTVAELARAAATRWKHFAQVGHWRLLTVYGDQCALIAVSGQQVDVAEMVLTDLPAYDQALWQRRAPRQLDATELAAERPSLPAELAAPTGQALYAWPVQQGSATLGWLSLLAFEPRLGALDRKFIGLVAAALATRIVSILTEQRLQAERVTATRMALEQRQSALLARLVNGVAHELNTPLGVQLGACSALEQLVEDTALPATIADDLRDTLALVQEQARRAARIVQRLKQITAAAQSGPCVRTPLAELLHDIAAEHAPLAVHFGALPALTLDLDRQALAGVLGELLTNVRDHAGRPGAPGQARIEVQATGSRLLLQVFDEGPGLGADAEHLLFEPFQTTRRAQGHMGIGGYIAHKLAREALQAELLLETAPGRTCVTLALPLTVAVGAEGAA